MKNTWKTILKNVFRGIFSPQQDIPENISGELVSKLQTELKNG